MENVEPIIEAGWTDENWPPIPMDENAIVAHIKVSSIGGESTLLEFHDPHAGIHVFPA